MKRRVLLPVFALSAAAVWGHPMGNASVSHYSRIERTPSGADIRYVLDFAEVPAIEILRAWDRGPAVQKELVEAWAHGLRISAGGRTVDARVERFTAAQANGCIRITAHLRVDAHPGGLRFIHK